jgi:hypothetical protein
VWPGITPLNVWDLTYDFWLLYALAAEQKDKQEKADRERRR